MLKVNLLTYYFVRLQQDNNLTTDCGCDMQLSFNKIVH